MRIQSMQDQTGSQPGSQAEARGIAAFPNAAPPEGIGPGPCPEAPARERVFLVVADESPEMQLALRFACGRARRTGGRVALFSLVRSPESEFSHWLGVDRIAAIEAYDRVQLHLQRLGQLVLEWAGMMPILCVREGKLDDGLFDVIEEDQGISVLVLAASADFGRPGHLISSIEKKLLRRLRIPIIVIPGSLSLDDIDALT